MLTSHSHQTDENWVEYYQATGDKQAVGELFRRHSLMCFAVCNKYLGSEEPAKDAAMAVFEKLFTLLHQHQIQNFKSWLHTVCKNHCLMQLRKPTLYISGAEELQENEESFMQWNQFLHPEEEKEQKLLELELAMVALTEKQRHCIDLFYLKQKSYIEISNETGYPLNEVRSHIQNGKRNLKNILAQKGIVWATTLLLWIQHTA